MMQISRDYVVWVDPEEGKKNSADLLKLAKRLDSERGLKQDTRERLHPLKDQQNLARLLLLPHAILLPLKRIKSPTRREALEYSLGLVLMILTYCPLRIGSLCNLRIDKHLKWSKPDMGGDLLLCFSKGELKNGEPCDLPLPPDCASAIRTYIFRLRPLLLTCRTPFLLPSIHEDMPKWKGDVARQLKALIFDRTGFTVNTHLFRHIVHLVVLNRFPGAMAMVSRVLTHRSLDTAVKNYAYYDVEISMRAYQRLISEAHTPTKDRDATLGSIAYMARNGEDF
jgi:integrase